MGGDLSLERVGSHPLNANGRPLPIPDDRSREFWAAAATHTFVLARCGRCRKFNHPPGAVCAHCGSTEPEFEFVPVDGSGFIRSWTIMRQSFIPGFEVPFVLVDVELSVQEDLRLIGRLVDGLEAQLRLGDAVSLVFDELAVDVAVPAFALVSPE